MMNLTDLIIDEDITIKEAIRKLNETGRKILIVTNGRKLKGTVTDGDIRRWILKNGDLQSNVAFIMNTTPKFLREADRYKAKSVLQDGMIEAIPIINEADDLVDIIFWNDNFLHKLNHYNKLDNTVVIMAGGKGTRLEPYTKIIPKPLIPIGDQTIVERIINRFTEYGCDQFYLTVNYKKNMIKSYFQDLENKNYEVNYVEEQLPLGTAGSLSLMEGQLLDTFFVSNCDILIDGNYSEMLLYHKENKNKITMITSLKQYAIPYGVVEINDSSEVRKLVEKPEYDLLVNTGMYILEPETLADIPKDTFFHITELINLYISRGEKIGVFPVSDDAWLDMGQMKEMEHMLERLGINK
jgi:dTDP-glucose pyrophosphorylase